MLPVTAETASPTARRRSDGVRRITIATPTAAAVSMVFATLRALSSVMGDLAVAPAKADRHPNGARPLERYDRFVGADDGYPVVPVPSGDGELTPVLLGLVFARS